VEYRIARTQSFAAAGVIAVALVGLVIYAYLGPGSAPKHVGFEFSFNIPTIAPKAADWRPNPERYCAIVGRLTSQLPDALAVALVVDAAPNAVAHSATLVLYKDLVAGRSTSADWLRVQAAYACPAS